MINNRQNGRRRGRGGGQQQRQGGGGGGQGQRDSGNRIDSRARGNAPQLLEKYKNMARDAQMAGDRVNTEYYLQFADHYFRVIADQRGRSDDQPVRRQRDDFDQFDDMDDFGDEGEPIRAEEQSRVSETESSPGRERFRDDRNRDERPREERQRDDRPREDRSRDDRPRADRARDDRRPAPISDDRLTPPADDMRDATPVAAAPLEEEAPRRRRVRKPREEASESQAPAAMEADRLPPALNVAPERPAGDEEAPKPRRRRTRTTVEAASVE